jgi:ribosomal protein S18 acetylase RimI-like enzyme
MTEEAVFSIRDARNPDRAAIGALWRELMALHRAFDPRFTVSLDNAPEYLRSIQDKMRSRDARVLVAEAQATRAVIAYMVGEIHVRPAMSIAGRFGFISDVCVASAWRHQGVGSALFEQMQRWFEARKVQAIELYVAEANPDADAFWHAMGFRPFLKLLHLDLENTS